MPYEPTEPADEPAPRRTKACYIGRSYNYLCQVGNTFTYSHVPFGKVVWHR